MVKCRIKNATYLVKAIRALNVVALGETVFITLTMRTSLLFQRQ